MHGTGTKHLNHGSGESQREVIDNHSEGPMTGDLNMTLWKIAKESYIT